MGFEAFDTAWTAHRAKVERLNRIAVDVYHGNRESFIKAMAEAWERADPTNKRIILPAWEAIVVKYGLEEDPTGTGRRV